MKRVDRLSWRDDYRCPECLVLLEISERAGAVTIGHPLLYKGFHTDMPSICGRANTVGTLLLIDWLYATNRNAQPIALLRIPKQIMGDCRLLLGWEIMPCMMRVKWTHSYPFDTYGNEVIRCRCTIIKPIAAYTIFV